MRRFFAIWLLVTLAACAPQAESEDAPLYDGLRAGTIKTGEDLYMIPLKQTDADGCQGYRQYSPTHLVTMAIYYQDHEGRFTANKLQAPCYAKALAKD